MSSLPARWVASSAAAAGVLAMVEEGLEVDEKAASWVRLESGGLGVVVRVGALDVGRERWELRAAVSARSDWNLAREALRAAMME